MERPIQKIAIGAALTALLFGMAATAVAQDANSNTRPRPRITIHPRTGQPGPNAKRYCHAQLVKEYRVSGPVIVPRMQCWWQ